MDTTEQLLKTANQHADTSQIDELRQVLADTLPQIERSLPRDYHPNVESTAAISSGFFAFALVAGGLYHTVKRRANIARKKVVAVGT